MFYITESGERLSELLAAHYGAIDARWRRAELIKVNMPLNFVDSLDLLTPYSALYLPEVAQQQTALTARLIVNSINSQCWQQRRLLRYLCRAGVTPLQPLAAIQAAQFSALHTASASAPSGLRVETGISAATLLHGMLDVHLEKAEHFTRAYHAMQRALLDYRSLFYQQGNFVTQALRNQYAKNCLERPYRELMQAYAARVALQPTQSTTTLGRLRQSALLSGEKVGFKGLQDVFTSNQMMRSLKYVKPLMNNVVVVELGLNILNVTEGYLHGDQAWQKGAALALGGFAGGFLGGELAAMALVLTPVGWVALLVGGVAGVTGEIIGKKLTELVWNQVAGTSLNFNLI